MTIVGTEEGIAELRLAEYPWQGVQLSRDCLCSNLTERLLFHSLGSTLLELSFVVTRMNVTQDYLDFYFEGEYRFVPVAAAGPDQSAAATPACHGSSSSLSDSARLSRLEDRRLRGTSGEISLRSPPQTQPILPTLNTVTMHTSSLSNQPPEIGTRAPFFLVVSIFSKFACRTPRESFNCL